MARRRLARSAHRRLIAGLAISLLVALALGLAFGRDGDDTGEEPASDPAESVPVAAAPAPSTVEAAVAGSFAHVLYRRSPGGVEASARRTLAFRPAIERAVAGTTLDADMLEALVFVESAGRPTVVAGDDVASAAGLTQILAGTATDFLGMEVDLARSREIAEELRAADLLGDVTAVSRLEAERRRVDQRFDPEQALAGTVRYLSIARERFGRDDMAYVSYHMGIGNLEGVLRRYVGADDERAIGELVRAEGLSYAGIFFGASPRRHAEAWQRLTELGDDSRNYYWKLLAAREILRLYREDIEEIPRQAALHLQSRSAELALHPPSQRPRLTDGEELDRAWEDGRLVALDTLLSRGISSDPSLGARALELEREPRTYRGVQPAAASALGEIGSLVRAISGERSSLVVTRAAGDEEYEALLGATASGIYATGFAVDVSRQYTSAAQRSAFQFALERFEALGIIAWLRKPSAIRIVVAADAEERLRRFRDELG